MDAVTLLRRQIEGAHQPLEQTMAYVTPEQVHWRPPGTANPLGATYGHVVASEDFLVNTVLRGQAPLLAGPWSGRTGLSELPPGPDAGEEGPRWFRRVKLDLPALRKYAEAVYTNTVEYVASLGPADLDRPIDLSRMGLGQQPVGWVLGNIITWHIGAHSGEVSCLKGLQGVRGYPF